MYQLNQTVYIVGWTDANVAAAEEAFYTFDAASR